MSITICVNERIPAMKKAIQSSVGAEMRIRQMFRRQLTRPFTSFLRLTLYIACAMGLLIASAVSHPVYAQAQHTNVRLDGDFANFTFVDNETGASAFLQVSRGGTAEEPQTSLFFQTERIDLVNNRIITVSGSGFIPNADFIGGSGQSLDSFSLRTNTTNNPDFSAEELVCDLQTSDCTINLISGAIIADFQKTRSFFGRFHGSSEIEFIRPDGTSVRNHSVGTQIGASAKAQASIFGIVFNNDNGNVGSNHSVAMTIEKTAH